MKQVVSLLTLTMGLLSVNISEARTLKCTYESLGVCTGQAKLAKVTVELKGNSFSTIVNHRACYFETNTQWTGSAVQVGETRGGLKIKLQAKQRRKVEAGNNSQWVPDNSTSLLTLDKDLTSGTLSKKGSKTLNLVCE